MASSKKKTETPFYTASQMEDARGPVAKAVPMEKAGLKKPVPESAASKKAAKSPLPRFDEKVEVQVDPKNPNLSADAVFVPDLDGLSHEAKLAADIARIRAGKQPFGALTQKLALPKIRGYYTHWFSDDPPGRVQEQFERGWSSRTDDKKRPIKRIIGKARDGSGLVGYALMIPDVFREEEMERRNAEARARMDAIKRNPFNSEKGRALADKSDSKKFYSVGDEVLSVETGPV